MKHDYFQMKTLKNKHGSAKKIGVDYPELTSCQYSDYGIYK